MCARIGDIHDCHFRPICAFTSCTESAALAFVRPVVPERKDCLSNCGEPGDIGGSMLSKSTSCEETPGFLSSLGRGGD